MAFRRQFNSSRRPTGSRFSRFRGRPMNTVRRPIKWERGNFHIETTHEHLSPDDKILTVNIIAQVKSLMDPATTVGRNISQMVRSLQIGGIVGTIQWNFGDPPFSFGAPSSTEDTRIQCKTLLCSDRLQAQDGGPAALLTDWFTNTIPVTFAAEAVDEQEEFPTRIHHQTFDILDPGQYVLLNASGDWVKGSVVSIPRHTLNKRLRLRLQDDECLVWHIATKVDSGTLDRAPTVKCTLSGTIYYRVQM